MKVWEVIGLGAVAVFGWHLWQLYEAGSNLAINIVSVDLSNFPNVNVVLSAQNMTNTPLTINSVAGNISVNGSPLGSFSATTPVTIAPSVVTNVPLTFSASLANLPNSIATVISNLGGSLSVTIQGSANVASVPVPVPFNITQQFQLG